VSSADACIFLFIFFLWRSDSDIRLEDLREWTGDIRYAVADELTVMNKIIGIPFLISLGLPLGIRYWFRFFASLLFVECDVHRVCMKIPDFP